MTTNITVTKIEMRMGRPNARPIMSSHARIPNILKSAVESVDAHGSGALVWLKQTHAARNKWKAFGHLLRSSRLAQS